MKNQAELRRELAHLHVLAEMTTDDQVLAEISKLVQELEERLRQSGNGAAMVVTPGSVWWLELVRPQSDSRRSRINPLAGPGTVCAPATL